MILRVPPENLWPTGAAPPELRESLHASGQIAQEVQQNGIANYQPPARQFNAAEIEAERQSLRLVESVSPQLPPLRPVPQGTPAQVQRYLVPLSTVVNAEIIIHGHATARDFRLLQKYVRLMSSVEHVNPQVNTPAPVAVNIKKPRKNYAASA